MAEQLVYDDAELSVFQDTRPGASTRRVVWKAGTPQAIRDDLETKARTALNANATYLALANPTTAQNTAQIQKLTRECNGVMRLLMGWLDSNANT